MLNTGGLPTTVGAAASASGPNVTSAIVPPSIASALPKHPSAGYAASSLASGSGGISAPHLMGAQSSPMPTPTVLREVPSGISAAITATAQSRASAVAASNSAGDDEGARHEEHLSSITPLQQMISSCTGALITSLLSMFAVYVYCTNVSLGQLSCESPKSMRFVPRFFRAPKHPNGLCVSLPPPC